MAGLQKVRPYQLQLFFSNKYAYAQIWKVSGDKHTVAAAASTIEKGLQEGLASTSDKGACARVAQTLAERAQAAGIDTVSWQRKPRQRFHGKVAALVTGLKEAGIKMM
ncbi:hypothetical protein ACKKBG_A01430 [Auxenochlorella protothecoides x Auxenochlorella symbiontica]